MKVNAMMKSKQIILTSGGSRISQGRQPLSLGQKPITWQDFCRNLNENERNWTGRGSLAPPSSCQCIRFNYVVYKCSQKPKKSISEKLFLWVNLHKIHWLMEIGWYSPCLWFMSCQAWNENAKWIWSNVVSFGLISRHREHYRNMNCVTQIRMYQSHCDMRTQPWNMFTDK